jgi:dinuclear metal center YbgI/SA1388 family protein
MDHGSINRDSFAKYLEQALDITRFRDYCPNGLQVEGRPLIRKLITGVTASLALIEAAVEADADAVLVHHGYFWRGEDLRVVGTKQRRLKLLLTKDINLFAYHLPLDMHPDFGNNAQLGRRLNLVADGRFGENDLGWLGVAGDASVKTVGDLARVVEASLGRAPLVIGNSEQVLGRLGWCTGGAHNMLGDAIIAGATAYLSGEISEATVHLARESGVSYFSCGHHATERFGVQALGAHLAEQFGIEHRFIDIANPV